MSTRFNKPKDLRYQIILDDESSDQLELLKEFSEYKKIKNNGVVIKAIETLFDQELKRNPDLKLEWQKINKVKERKIINIKEKYPPQENK